MRIALYGFTRRRFFRRHLYWGAFSARRAGLAAFRLEALRELQPLFAAGWSQIFLAEPISRGAVLGGLMMVGATLLACTDRSVCSRRRTAAVAV